MLNSSANIERISLGSFAAHSAAAAALIQDVLAARAAHAVLITGMPGVGKRTLGFLLSCAALCTGEGTKPCFRCRSCVQALRGTHLQLLAPDETGSPRTIKVDDLRDILHMLSFRAPGEGRRVVFLPDADRMTPQAQNALLKSLEEPDAGTLFILTASLDSALLSTVRSRCRKVPLEPWPPEEVQRVLLRRGVAAEAASAAAALCEGSIGRALQICDNPDYFALRDLCCATFFSVSEPADVPAAAQQLKDSKANAPVLLEQMEHLVRQLLRRQLRQEREENILPSAARGAALWYKTSADTLVRVLEALLTARKYLASNVSWQSVSERLLYFFVKEIASWQPS